MALEQFKLDGHVAIVTGAGRGVGAGIARVLAEAGATVVGFARTESQIVGTINGIENAGGKGLAIVADAMKRATATPPTQPFTLTEASTRTIRPSRYPITKGEPCAE